MSQADAAKQVLEGLVSGWPEGKAPRVSKEEAQSLNALIHSLPDDARSSFLMLARKWHCESLFTEALVETTGSLKKKIEDHAAENDERINAARDWIGLQDGPVTVRFILDQINSLTSPDLSAGFIGALAESRNPETGRLLLAHWSSLAPSARRVAIGTLLRRVEWANSLLDAVEAGAIRSTDIARENWTQLKSNPNQALSKRAEKISNSGGAVSADRAEIVKKLLPLAKEAGNPVRGKEVFTTVCVVCHTFNGQGGKVGPDLTGIAARDRSEILIDILDPNRSVEANYRLWNVATRDGETFAGRLETETQTTVEILDAAGQKHVLQRKDIDKLTGSELSIMPNGFESLPAEDLKALLAYLTQPRKDQGPAR
jgi:putative heme-binding domain-containing protein